MKISQVLSLLPVAAGLIFASAAQARDSHGWHGGHDWHRGGYYRGGFGPSISFGYYSSPFYDPWYYGPPVYSYYASPVVVPVAPRVYDARRYSSVQMDVQLALTRRGYYRGVIDGDIGPASRAAIRAFQRDKGLPVTGRIDESLVRALRV